MEESRISVLGQVLKQATDDRNVIAHNVYYVKSRRQHGLPGQWIDLQASIGGHAEGQVFLGQCALFASQSAKTHVSLLPPPCEELTNSEPLVMATRVRPPGTTSISRP